MSANWRIGACAEFISFAADHQHHTIAGLSERVDTAPEVILRSLSALAADGLIACTRTMIAVLDPGALAQIGQVDEAAGFA